ALALYRDDDVDADHSEDDYEDNSDDSGDREDKGRHRHGARHNGPDSSAPPLSRLVTRAGWQRLQLAYLVLLACHAPTDDHGGLATVASFVRVFARPAWPADSRAHVELLADLQAMEYALMVAATEAAALDGSTDGDDRPAPPPPPPTHPAALSPGLLLPGPRSAWPPLTPAEQAYLVALRARRDALVEAAAAVPPRRARFARAYLDALPPAGKTLARLYRHIVAVARAVLDDRAAE
ncbi:hypothetical protein HK405_001937, partial [Cladochytrium tenue]